MTDLIGDFQSGFGKTRGSYPNKITFDLVTKPIIVEDNVWIAAGCRIAPGVTLERGCVLGFSSVATRNIPANTIWAGNPAVEVRKRNQS